MKKSLLHQTIGAILLFTSGWAVHKAESDMKPSAPIAYSDALMYRNHFKSTIDSNHLFPEYFVLDSTFLSYLRTNPTIERVRMYLIRYNNSQKPPTFPTGTINVVFAPEVNGSPDKNRLFNYTGVCPPDCGSNTDIFLK